MKNTEKVLEENKDLIVAFHIGRGGRYHNAGFLTYIGENDINDFTDALFLNETETFYTTGNGREVLAVDNDGTGEINIDNEYNTTYAKKVADLDEEEIFVILKTKDMRGFYGLFAEELIQADSEDNYESEDNEE